jgi:hypothetical protein
MLNLGDYLESLSTIRTKFSNCLGLLNTFIHFTSQAYTIGSLLKIGHSSDPSFLEEEAPFFKKRKSLERTKIWPWVLMGSEIKIECGGEGHQQFN